jgi:ABC-type multidrug transport system permease subunit
MTTSTEPTVAPATGDHRGTFLPTGAMIMTRFMELRKRRGLMIALLAVNIGVPTIFLAVRVIAHAVAPHSYGPAGGYDIFQSLVAGVMYIFGFIVAATLGCTAGSVDLTEGMFRHLVVTGRSRLSLYFARIPAGLMIIVPVVAVGIVIVCSVCVFAAPTKLNFNGINNMPVGLSRQGFITWAEDHPKMIICDMGNTYIGPSPQVNCAPNNELVVVKTQSGSITSAPATKTEIREQAIRVAEQNYKSYAATFLSPPLKLMIETGLWVELWAVIGFLVGLGLSSLMGQRTVPVVLLIVFEIVLTPLFSRVGIPHLINVQRAMVGLAMVHIEPAGLPAVFGGMRGGGGGAQLLTESTTVAVVVIVAWIVVWTGLGAWRMATRDA